ncbi:MAG: CDP-diacylglycerol--glycerol-3-phosphate 3-phosphatidyltransferase [Magnetococcales bacterium]|nr:CDP-diacylglycerol--glycerol-3-phosphate 3-phosphatidyltransferase [Magnetococcales bacterium]
MVLNLPNTLTATRILLIPFMVASIYLPGGWGKIVPTAIFGIAALTDWADGYVARNWQMSSAFGRFFDPVADKLLVISALMLLVAEQRAPVVLVLLITAREITITALREFMAGVGGTVPVSRLGKWKTGFQMTAILMLLVQDGLWGLPLDWPGLISLYICTILTLWSGYDYLAGAWTQIRERIGG